MNRKARLVRTTRRVSSVVLAAAQFIIASVFLPSAASATTPAFESPQKTSGVSVSTGKQPATAPRCQTTGTAEISIICDYTSVPVDSEPVAGEPRVALNHAALSFKTKHDGWASLTLTFTKLDPDPISQPRLVYLAVDDDSGHNFIRRVLPHVDFHTLAPGKPTEFSEHLLIPALQPGHYQIELWIPSSEPSLKFNIKRNFLISSIGVADTKTGLNRIAKLSIVR